MMTKDEFKQQLLDDVQKKFPDRKVQINKVQKSNEPLHDALQVECKNESGLSVFASQSVDMLYAAYQKEDDYETFLCKMISNLKENLTKESTANVKQFADIINDYEKAKDRLALKIIPTCPNEGFLAITPHKEILNMSVIVMVVAPESETGKETVATSVVTKGLMEQWGKTEEQLFADAEKSTQKIRPYQVKSMAETLAEMMNTSVDELPLPNDGPQMYVVTNNVKIHGASVLAYPKFFDEMAELMNGSFYVIPSSIHEILVIPEKDAMELSDLDAMVMEVNTTQVDPTEQLADNAFHYDATEKIFETCEDYKERMEKENDRSDR